MSTWDNLARDDDDEYIVADQEEDQVESDGEAYDLPELTRPPQRQFDFGGTTGIDSEDENEEDLGEGDEEVEEHLDTPIGQDSGDENSEEEEEPLDEYDS
jgi:hypothetical protein